MVSPFRPYNMVGQPALTDHTTTSVCWSVSLCFCLSLSACLSVRFSLFLSFTTCLSVGLFLSVFVFHHLSVCFWFLSFVVSVCMSVCSVLNFLFLVAQDEIVAAHSIGFTSDGKYLVSGFNRTLRCFDTNRPGRDCVVTSTVCNYLWECGVLCLLAQNCLHEYNVLSLSSAHNCLH